MIGTESVIAICCVLFGGARSGAAAVQLCRSATNAASGIGGRSRETRAMALWGGDPPPRSGAGNVRVGKGDIGGRLSTSHSVSDPGVWAMQSPWHAVDLSCLSPSGVCGQQQCQLVRCLPPPVSPCVRIERGAISGESGADRRCSKTLNTRLLVMMESQQVSPLVSASLRTCDFPHRLSTLRRLHRSPALRRHRRARVRSLGQECRTTSKLASSAAKPASEPASVLLH